MQKSTKKTIGGIVLATILVAGMFAFMPQSASADLTALDKIGTIINIITSIFTEVTNIEEKLDGTRPSLVTNINQTVTNINATVNSPVFGNEEIKNEVRNIEGNVTQINATVTNIQNDIQDKKSFWHVEVVREGISQNGTITIQMLLDCPSHGVLFQSCGFNVEYIVIRVGGGVGASESFTITEIMISAGGVIDIADITLDSSNTATVLLSETGLVQLASPLIIDIIGDVVVNDTIDIGINAVGEKPQAAELTIDISEPI